MCFVYEMDECFWRNTKFPEHCIHKTISGNIVRSKSEALIDMALYTHGILPGIHLITTYETKDKPLTSETIDRIINEFFT